MQAPFLKGHSNAGTFALANGQTRGQQRSRLMKSNQASGTADQKPHRVDANQLRAKLRFSR